jgi:hypothetical protein
MNWWCVIHLDRCRWHVILYNFFLLTSNDWKSMVRVFKLKKIQFSTCFHLKTLQKHHKNLNKVTYNIKTSFNHGKNLKSNWIKKNYITDLLILGCSNEKPFSFNFHFQDKLINTKLDLLWWPYSFSSLSCFGDFLFFLLISKRWNIKK